MSSLFIVHSSQKQTKKKNTFFVEGFTLIELIVGIAILAVISIFVIVTLNPYQQFLKAQDTKRKSDLSQIQKALETYYQDNGRYPSSKNSVSNAQIYKIVTTEPNPQNIKNWGDAWTPYIQILPKDVGGREYIYYVTDANGQSYYLYAALERKDKDPQVCNPNSSTGGPCTNAPVNCGSAVCNYGVTSSNVSP